MLCEAYLECLSCLQERIVRGIGRQLRTQSFGRCQQIPELALCQMAYQVKRNVCTL